MSAQILLQGRLQGAEQFLLAIPADRDNRAFEARSTWLVLVGEAIPRALLAELQLPPLMLGSSGGDRFFVILPDRGRADAAGEFLARVSQALSELSAGKLSIVWSSTENLGDWTIVRKRLQEGMRAGTGGGAHPQAAEARLLRSVSRFPGPVPTAFRAICEKLPQSSGVSIFPL